MHCCERCGIKKRSLSISSPGKSRPFILETGWQASKVATADRRRGCDRGFWCKNTQAPHHGRAHFLRASSFRRTVTLIQNSRLLSDHKQSDRPTHQTATCRPTSKSCGRGGTGGLYTNTAPLHTKSARRRCAYFPWARHEFTRETKIWNCCGMTMDSHILPLRELSVELWRDRVLPWMLTMMTASNWMPAWMDTSTSISFQSAPRGMEILQMTARPRARIGAHYLARGIPSGNA